MGCIYKEVCRNDPTDEKTYLSGLVQTKLFPFEPGRVYHMTVGNIGNDLFIAIDGVLALEIHDPDPIDIMKYGRIGFEAYCTKVKYRDVKVRRVTYMDVAKPYDPEFWLGL